VGVGEVGVGEVRVGVVGELDPTVLFGILRLRVDVFVVEQQCPYPDLDGRDVEPGARMLWLERGGEVVATARLLREPDGAARIGRVVTAPAWRGRGLAATLIRRALELSAGRAAVLDAQSHWEHWYQRFGFVRDGAEFVEDGIPHVPMRRAGRVT